MEIHQYIGVDLHKAFFQVCALDPRGERVWETRYDRSPDGIRTFVTRCTPQTAVAVEATTPTWRPPPWSGAGSSAGSPRPHSGC